MIDTNPGASRVALSRLICEQLKWRSANGKLKDVNCRVVLLKLQRAGAIRLPKVKKFPGKRWQRQPAAKAYAAGEIAGSLKTVQPIELVLIGGSGSKESEVWNELMNRYHYLGASGLVGAQLRYLIRSSRGEWLGGLSFSAAA